MPGSRRASPSAENVAAVRALLTRRGILDDVYAERFVSGRKRVTVDVLALLPEPAVRSLLSQAAELGPAGSRLGVEFVTKAVAAAPLRSRWLPAVVRVLQRWSGEPLRSELQQEDVPTLLRDTGWNSAEVFTGADLYARHLRTADLPSPPVGSSVWSATKS